MKLMVTLLALGALVAGGFYYYDSHRTKCSSAGFGIIGSVRYCQRPDGSVYLDGVPTPAPAGATSGSPTSAGATSIPEVSLTPSP